MAALRGTLVGNRGEVSRLGSKNSGIRSRLNTWSGAIITRLEADGTFTVKLENRGGDTVEVLRGNTDTQESTWTPQGTDS